MVLTGKTPAKQRKAVRARIESKEIDALCVVKIGLEGFDCPPLGCAILARQFGVVSEYLQSIGRVRRVLPGKPISVCIDLVGSVFLHGLPDEDRVWSLSGAAVRLKDPASSLSVRRCGECLAVFFPQSICPVCGASTAGDMKMPRTLSRVDQLAKLESVPVEIRDRAYLDKLRDVALNRIRVPPHLVDIKAAELFRQRFKREPVCA
jgi:superfamily II DNA or RNA helicase